MMPMRRVILLGTRDGERAIHWPGLIRTFAMYMVVFTLGRDFVGWCWNAIFGQRHPSDGGRTLAFGLVMSVLFLGIALWRSRRSPLAYLPVLDRPS